MMSSPAALMISPLSVRCVTIAPVASCLAAASRVLASREPIELNWRTVWRRVGTAQSLNNSLPVRGELQIRIRRERLDRTLFWTAKPETHV